MLEKINEYRQRVVAPLAGAWIEIGRFVKEDGTVVVAPLAGAWIEINLLISVPPLTVVAPLAGAWIEMDPYLRTILPEHRRSPCGSVD